MIARERLEGAEALHRALVDGRPVSLVLARRSGLSEAASRAVEAARTRGVPVRGVSDAVLRRFSDDGRPPAEVLALVGATPAATLPELMGRTGDVWLLAGLRYPGNVGGAIRTLEVAGAAGVVVAAGLAPASRRRAVRASMRADRLFPVLFAGVGESLGAARAAGRAVIALETGGEEPGRGPPLPSRALLVAGGEHVGLDVDLLAAADRVLRLPTSGFIPSYNVQAAVAMAAALRAQAT